MSHGLLALATSLLLLSACKGKGGDSAATGDPSPTPSSHGPVAADIAGPMGTPWPSATAEQLATFERGLAVMDRRFAYEDGLGPAFNVTFCGSCHEKPVPGGAGGLYRNFWLTGIESEDGAFFPATSAGESGGVVRLYHRPDPELAPHPELDDRTNIVAQRNPIAFFGVGLLAEIEGDVILANADPDDADGDGVSGRPNYDRGFVGRFGRKSQTVSIEGFIRGPLRNHLGVTTDPLSDAAKAALPVDSSSTAGDGARAVVRGLLPYGQAAASDAPTRDDDGVPDPELSPDDLFDLVSAAMLMAAPVVRTELTDAEVQGLKAFDRVGCGDCHTPRLDGPRGPLPLYSDLLLHDMGDALEDGLVAGEATGREFRTQPLWGLAAVGPYLHDGRATTLDEAIRWHDGEALSSRRAYARLSESDRDALVDFLLTLGGVDQATGGLLLPGQPIPGVGEYGGPIDGLDADGLGGFGTGRRIFDNEFGFADGAGAPRFNGDSCRACHFEPVIGGAGPLGVNVVRHGIINGEGEYVEPTVGSILHRSTALPDTLNAPQEATGVYELRQTPALFGVGLIDVLPDSVILANEDPDDADGDGISGRVSWVDGGRLGRFGWKGQVPSLAEFGRDAVSMELGMTVPYADGMTFGKLQDDDGIPDPEMTQPLLEALVLYMQQLGPPPRQPGSDGADALAGEAVFETVGCATCHVPTLEGPDGPVPLYSDLLLHEILPPGTLGIEEAGASMTEFRTPPLWGVSQTGPWLHDGSADTFAQAIEGHAGEADASVSAWAALDATDQSALLAFLGTL
jgi:CxxC motif-containing protein (DUF1111 family)